MSAERMILEDFMLYFSGNDRVYGQHTFGVFADGMKEEGGKNFTVNELIKDKNYSDHINGTGNGLGIVPITYDNSCRFVVIDIDIYDEKLKMNAKRVIRAIFDNGLPISVFTSKSGGYHLYIFFKEWTQAVKAREIAMKYIRLLSMDKICGSQNRALEIFPKQNTITKDQKGSWINLPYYNASKELKRQRMLGEDFEGLSISEALMKIKSRAMTHEEHVEALKNSAFSDAPPCLQSLYYLNDIKDNRNNFLFSFGVYLFKKNEDTYAQELYKVNQRLPKPLPDGELEDTILKSVRTKSYGYKCKESPLCDICSKTECRDREFGIGDNKHVSDLDFGKMWQLACDPPEYYWVINGVEIRFRNEEEMLNQNKFRVICVRKLLFAPYKLKDEAWVKALNGALSDCEIKDLDGEVIDQRSRIVKYFVEYLTERSFGADVYSCRTGRVFKDFKAKKYYFKGAAFADWLVMVKNYREYSAADVGYFLRSTMECEMYEDNGFKCMAVPFGVIHSEDTVITVVEDVKFEDKEEGKDPSDFVVEEKY